LESQPPVDAEPQPTQPSPPATPSGFVPPTAEALAERFPQLEIVELLGRGGMGAVYKARQKELDRLVAMKILPPEVSADPAFAERFTREARALARLSHPNIVAVYDFGRTGDGQFYFVMEYVDGVNLRQAIQSGGMTPKEALAIVPQICDALQFAHDEGIVHRDIKPENILIDKKGRVKIADFGLTKLLGRAPGDVSLTGTQQVMGTLRYMAPEQIEGTKAVDHRADIYSLGVVFYELLTGELPIGRFAPPSKKVQIDVRLDEVVLRALEKEPEQRYQHASEVKTEVEAIRGSAPAMAPAPAAEIGRDPTAMYPEVDRENQVRAPAFAVMAVGFLYIVAAILFATAGLWDPIEGGLLEGNWYAVQWDNQLQLAAFAALMVLGVAALVGGWKMLIGRSYSLAMLGSIVVLPVGFWGLAVLSRPDVRAAFARPATVATPDVMAHLRRPAIGLLVTGFLGLLPYLAWFVIYQVWGQSFPQPIWSSTVLSVLDLFRDNSLGVGMFLIVTAVLLLWRQGYWLAVVASVVAMLPISPTFIVGLPVGIWALATLSRPEVRAAFAELRGPIDPQAALRVWGPALALLITGAGSVLLFYVICVLLPNWFPEVTRYDWYESTIMTILYDYRAPLAIPMLLFGVLVSVGAAKMLTLRSYPMAMTGAVIAVSPIWPGFVLTLPFGIWALWVLARPEVKAGFGGAPPQRSPAPKSQMQDSHSSRG
jgi:predicted Ser/Thr protein kinase